MNKHQYLTRWFMTLLDLILALVVLGGCTSTAQTSTPMLNESVSNTLDTATSDITPANVTVLPTASMEVIHTPAVPVAITSADVKPGTPVDTAIPPKSTDLLPLWLQQARTATAVASTLTAAAPTPVISPTPIPPPTFTPTLGPPTPTDRPLTDSEVTVTITATATQLEIGDVVTVTITLDNIGRVDLRNASCNLDIYLEDGIKQFQSSLAPITDPMYAGAPYFTTNFRPGESITFDFTLRTLRSGTATLVGGSSGRAMFSPTSGEVIRGFESAPLELQIYPNKP